MSKSCVACNAGMRADGRGVSHASRCHVAWIARYPRIVQHVIVAFLRLRGRPVVG